MRSAVGLSTAIAAICLALSAIIWTAVISQEQRERQEAIAAAIKQNSNLAIAFEEYITRTIRGVDAVALFIKREYSARGAQAGISSYLQEAASDEKIFTAVNIFDEHGNMVASSKAITGVNIADREHFQVHVHGDSGKLFIGKPVLARTTGKWTILMTRRLNKRDGSFGGVISICVDPDYFNGFYQKADLSSGSLIALIGLDGVSRSQLLGTAAGFGQNLSNSQLMLEREKNPIGNTLTTSIVQGVPYYASYRTMHDYPLLVVVGNSLEEVLTPFAQRQLTYYWAAVLFSVVIVFFAALLIGALARQLRSVAALAASEARFRALTQLSSDWHWEHDENQVFTSISEHVLEKSGVGAGAILGRTRWELALHYAPEDRQALEADLAARRPFRDFEFSRLDENGLVRHAQVSGEPMFDDAGRYTGYRGIGKDITERKHREEDLRRFRAAMDSTSDAIFLTDRKTLAFVDVNTAACAMLGYTRDELLTLGP